MFLGKRNYDDIGTSLDFRQSRHLKHDNVVTMFRYL